MADSDYTICRVAVARTLALRKAVLRPHLSADEAYLPPDATAASTIAYAAVNALDVVIGAAVITPDEPPFGTTDGRAWRLRGMAVAPEHRNRGVGRAVLDAFIAHVAGLGGGILWCNARLAARGLYERAGMSAWGEIFEEPLIGPHVVMWRSVEGLTLGEPVAGAQQPGEQA
ncbi:MAG: GNAT family N-acetyltransferase [Actinomycetota bacterium]|nr:GNAT family N-acetyltransferase [Actinomycetota bacterium]